MKILFMIPKLSYSGAPKMMSWVANNMNKLGHDVAIVTMYNSENQQELGQDIKFHNLNYIQSSNWIYRNTIGMIKIIKSYRKFVKSYNPDVIISFMDSISQVYILLNKFLWKNKILVSERVDPFSRKGLKSKLYFKIMNMANFIVFQTKEAQNFFGERTFEKSVVIGNPVILNNSTKKIISKRKQEDFKTQKIISCVGRLSLKQKRQDIAIMAMSELVKEYNDYKLQIYGSGEDKNKIMEIIKKYGLEKNVILMGQQDNIFEKIYDSSCFILTSDYEGIPNALIEAMSIGLPCVSTDCSPGGARLLINNMENGFIVDRGDYMAVFDKIKWIIDNPVESKKIGEKAMNISKRFSENIIATQWEKAIKQAKDR